MPPEAMIHRARIALAGEFRVEIDAERGPVTASAFGHDYWRRVFGTPTRVTLVVRGHTKTSRGSAPDRQLVVGPDVDVISLPPLRLGGRLLVEIPKALRALRTLDPAVPVVLRMPGIVPTLTLLVLVCRRQSFAVQVVGDPLGVTFDAGVGGRMARIIGLVLAGSTWLGCRHAAVVAYVTEAHLQRRYPPGRRAKVHAFPNVQLSGSDGGRGRRTDTQVGQLLTVASLEQRYKRVDLLIEALAVLRHEGWPVRLQVAGAGVGLGPLRDLAERLGVGDEVSFRGMLPPLALAALYAESDMFVLCSDTEGMPRALIEAAAMGLPCVATAVGGIPEFLPPEALVEPGSLASLVATLRRHFLSPSLRERNAGHCAVESGRFAPSVLGPRRAAFLSDVLAMDRRGER